MVTFTSLPLYPRGNSNTNSPETKLSEPQSRPGRVSVPVTSPNKRLFNKMCHWAKKKNVHLLRPTSLRAPLDFLVAGCVDNAPL